MTENDELMTEPVAPPLTDTSEPETGASLLPTPQPVAPLRPRTRWAAIVWGLVMAAIAATALWIVASTERRNGFADWILTLSPPSIAAYAVLLVGGLALVAGLVGLARRLQRGRT